MMGHKENQGNIKIYGIGNPLIDILVFVDDDELAALGLHKGTMHLIDEERRAELITFISKKKAVYRCGGSCPNTIITMSALGEPGIAAGKTGNDEFHEIYKRTLTETGAFDQLTTCDKPTGSSIILISPDRERTMNTYLGANRFFGPEDVDEKSIAQAEIFHFTGYMWDTESQKAAVLKAIDIAHRHETLISFDIADPFAVSRNREAFFQLIQKHADITFANNEEARILFDTYDSRECAKELGKICTTGIVKNGKIGSFISHQKEILTIPVKGKEPIDTTGAGDIYAAGFLFGRCRRFSLYDSGLFASFLAGEIIRERGAQFSFSSIRRLRKALETGSWKLQLPD